MFSFQGLLLVGGHALLTKNLPVLLLLPVRGEVGAALGTHKGLDPQQRGTAFA